MDGYEKAGVECNFDDDVQVVWEGEAGDEYYEGSDCEGDVESDVVCYV